MNPKTKRVWKAVKYLNEDQCSIPALIDHDTTVQTDIGKADLLNSFFFSCYILSHIPMNQFKYHDLQPPHGSLPATVLPAWMSPMLMALMGFPLEY